MEHYWDKLPGPIWFSATLIYKQQVVRARHGAVFVEIGAWKGRSAAFMAVEIINSGKKIDFYTVDHWRGDDEPEYRSDHDVVTGHLFSVFQKNIEPVKTRVIPIRGGSTEISTRFADGSVDFIYIDAGHDYASVLADLKAWWPKLRSDGVMAGDDWCYVDAAKRRSVARAVTEFFEVRDQSVAIRPGDPNPEWSQWVVEKRHDT